MNTSLLGMNKEELLALNSIDVWWNLTGREILYLWETFNGSWFYDYQALKEGRPGLHAELKSKKCSDGFFMSRAVLQYDNLRKVIADQMVEKFNDARDLFSNEPMPDLVCGIPDGAKKLGEDVAEALELPVVNMKKNESGKLVLESPIGPGKTILMVEDFCTLGTGFAEALSAILSTQSEVRIFSHELVILNRGGLFEIVSNGENYKIAALLERRINDWDPETCPLCEKGSERIRPKATDANWRLLKVSQLAR